MVLRAIGNWILGRQPGADRYNQAVNKLSMRLMDGARPFGRVVARAVSSGQQQPEAKASYEELVAVVDSVRAGFSVLEVPDLPGAGELSTALAEFLDREVELARGPWREVFELVSGGEPLVSNEKAKVATLIEELGSEEDHLVAKLHGLQERFLRLNTR